MGKTVNELSRYIALLKGINVGGHTVKMDRLRELIGELGYEEVATYIASGNVIFSCSAQRAEELERSMAVHLESALGYAVPTFIRAASELEAIAAYRPFRDDELSEEGSSLYIAFLPDAPSDTEARRIESLSTKADRFRVARRELYWHCRTRFSDSPFSGPKLEKLLARPVTIRNSTTIRKLVDRYCVG